MELESELLKWIRANSKKFNSEVVVGIGDDCAVIDRGEYFEIIENDLLVEGNHFLGKWYSPEEIGRKAVESNVSDIAAMGGEPLYLCVALVLPKDMDIEYIKNVYKGIFQTCEKYKISLIGGDTTSGKIFSISISLIGRVDKSKIVLRSGAKAGDTIACTGTLGASMAGLSIVRNIELQGLSMSEYLAKIPSEIKRSFEYCLNAHFSPVAQLEKGKILASLGVNSMIDVSDGLASEVRHIANESGLGCIVYEDGILIDKRVRDVADFLQEDPLHYILSGGEDFELIFSASVELIERINSEFASRGFSNLFEFGKFTELRKIDGISHFEHNLVLIDRNGFENELTGGFVHFS